jgi:hypothetical protein
MSSEIKSYEEWAKRPSWHGGYRDYVAHMEGMARYRAEEEQDRLAEKIAEKLAEKLRKK